MTTKELMLGDYITLADCFNDGKEPLIFKVVGLGYDGENSALVLLNGEEACDIVEIDDEWCGIPITPEILEKNGFEDMGFYSECKVGDWRVLCDTKNVAILHREHCNIDTPVEYVHDLQHALKLCRIDKEIVI